MSASQESIANSKFIYQLPERIAQFRTELNDMDAHEAVPAKLWASEFGPEAELFANISMDTPDGHQPLIFNPDLVEDKAEINAHNVWKVKMEEAPGSFDLHRRIEVMNFIGTRRQVLFAGGFGQQAIYFFNKYENPNTFRKIKGTESERKRYAHKMIELHNDWCVRAFKGNGRLKVCAILLEDTVDEMYNTMRRLLGQGIRVFQISCTNPPAGISPAHPDIDRVWALAAEAGAGLMVHVDGSSADGFLKTQKWKDAPAFDGWRIGEEFALDPWTLTNLHLAVQNYLQTMVLGGVFDRHPNLFFGVQEFGAGWVGPFAENMDRYYSHTPFPTDIGERKLKMKPSDYVRRNVRVSPFDFEPVGMYIDRYGFEDVFCFASDFPHYEGGKQPIENFLDSLSRQSDAVLRKFFVENCKLVLRD
jgi:predicted TIM-barrel fold metal-dependent hydrolase